MSLSTILIVGLIVLILTICAIAMCEASVGRLIVYYFRTKEQYLEHLSKAEMSDQFKALH